MSERPNRAAVGSGLLLLLALAGASAQEGDSKTAPAIEPGVIEALDKMGAYLRTINNFAVQAEATIDEVLESGQKLQFDSTISIRAERPEHLWIEVVSDRKHRQFFYDGKTFTIWGPRNKYYASAPVTGTLAQLADRLETKYDIRLPLNDLFRWGAEAKGHPEIKGAIHVGPALVGEIPCNHFAFRQEGVDWQIWIQKGDAPLPIKLVITTTDDEARPQFVSVLDWNVAPALSADMFTFEPPKDANRIAIKEQQ